jgi:hypothetical protein
MATRMRQAQSLFTPTPQAGCSTESVRLASSALPAELLGETAAAAGPAGRQSSEHSDLDASFTFRCSSPERLRGLESRLLEVFPGIRTIKVSVVSARGQKASVLSKGRTSVQW